MYSLQGFPDEGSDNMKIEKVNENQIRCTLTREDLAERQIKLSELAYGTEKAKMLFRDMMQQAAYEFGFEADDIPLMIEAIPLSADTIILVITKVEYPEELDTRFSRFSDPDPEDLYEDAMSGSVQNAAAAGADDILGLFRKIQEEHKKAAKEPEGDTQTAESSEKTAKEETPVNVLVDITKLFVFKNLDEVVSKSDQSPETFNKVCNILSEYAAQQPYTPATGAFFREHYHMILQGNALQTLAEL